MRAETVRVFVQHAPNEPGTRERAAVQGVLDLLKSFDVEILTGGETGSEAEFRAKFRPSTGLAWSPRNLRMVQLGMLDAADALVMVRTGPSEAAAMEAAYNLFAGRRAPMFFALWKGAGAPSGMLCGLEEYCEAEYVEFERAEQLAGRLAEFLERAAEQRQESERQMIRIMEHLVA